MLCRDHQFYFVLNNAVLSNNNKVKLLPSTLTIFLPLSFSISIVLDFLFISFYNHRSLPRPYHLHHVSFNTSRIGGSPLSHVASTSTIHNYRIDTDSHSSSWLIRHGMQQFSRTLHSSIQQHHTYGSTQCGVCSG